MLLRRWRRTFVEVGGRGNPIFYMEMCKWHACLSLVREFLGWRERRGRRPCKKGDVICFNFLLFIQKCEVQWFVIQGPILMKKQKNEKIGLSNNNQGSTLSYISIYKPTVRAASPPLLPSILSSALLSPKSS